MCPNPSGYQGSGVNDAGRNTVEFAKRAIAMEMWIDRDQPVEGVRKSRATSREVTASPGLKRRSCRIYAR